MKRYDIAIIGMGGVFPGANNVEQYWKNIISGDTYITDMPEKYFRKELYFSEGTRANDKSYTMKGAFINDFSFPYTKYKLPPKTMKEVDPAQLVALESTREALKDAGIKPRSKELDDAITVLGVSGVDGYAHATTYLRRNRYMDKLKIKLQEQGVSSSLLDKISKEFDAEVAKHHPLNMSTAATGMIPSAISNRVAQVFGVKGFNMTVDAACASSFSALEVSCLALMAGDTRIAITGGVDLGVNPAIYIGFSRVEGLSFSGISNPFDHTADGLVIGEGGGVVILKRLEDALADGDDIKAVIRGHGSSSDGSGQAIYAPSVVGRARALRSALDIAGVTAHDIQFLEAHATSTIVGDANEYDAISSVYSEGRNPKDPLFLGSVKYQIGHLKAAAGVAGLIKVVKGMMHKTIPHMPLFSGLTPKATMKSEGLVVPTKLQEWHQNSDGKMIGAITSSGFGGSNYHLIIEKADSYETPKRKTLVDRNIAIIGVSMKLPSATDEQTFWNNISEGKKIFKPANKDELHWTQHVNRGPENERIETEVVSTIDEYKFNSLRHKILPKAISQIAPTQLLSLVLADELLDKHGFDYKAPKNIGVSVGAIHDDFFPDVYDPMITDDYAACVKACDSFNSLSSTIATSAITQTKEWVTKDSPPITEHTLPGWMGNIVSGRIANKLNLQGANIVVDSACSSSMAALLPAIYQLQFNKVDMMISGGVNRQMSDVFTAGVNAIGALAKDDARPFDESGKGYVIGEGGVYYLLKTVEKAKKDGDTIIAIINSVDGSSEAESKSMVAPSEIAARRAIKRTMDKSTVAADSIGVVDTHGSANKLSDIVEVQSLAKELRSSTTDTPLHITAIKSHVGHIYGGSGATSMLSVIHSLKNRKVPGIRNLKNLRPEIEDVKNRACPVFKTTTLSDTTDAGGVISLGLGGANYFAVITLDDAATKVKTSTPPIVEPPKSTVISRRSDSTYDNGVFLCSADQESTLIDILSRTVTLDKIPSHIAKGDGSIRFSATYNNQEELKTKLNQTIKFFSAGHNLKPLESQGIFLADNSDRNEKLAFCFPGQGTHYISMGKFLYDSHPVFRDILDEIDALAKSELNFNLIDHIYGDPQSQQIKQNLATLTGAQISLFAVEVGVAKVMESLGVKPHVLIGHSFGEISALTFAGVWDIPTAFKVVKARIAAAQIAIDANDKPLGMMSIICSEEKRDALLKPLKGRIYLTNVNAPGRFIFAGEKELVQSTVELAEAFGIDATVLPIETAFHSPYMRPAQASFEQTLRQLPCNTPRFPILSTVNGEYINASHISSEGLAQHLSSQLVTTLNLPREITKLYDDGVKHYLEVGPGWSMTKMISSILKHHHFRAVPTLHPKIGDVEVFRRGKAFLAAAGHLKAEGEMRNLSNFISSDLLHFLRDHDSALLGQLGKVHTKFLQWKELHKIETVKPVLHQRPQATIETIAPVAAQKSALAVVAPPSGEASPEWIKRVKDELVEMTGYPADMLETNVDLEADLGIDSIQRAELWVIITKKYSLDETVKPTQPIKTILGLAATFGEIEAGNTPPPTEPTEAPAPVVTESALAVAAPPSGNASPEWIKRVKDELVEMTGYPADMLETNVDLEADLGIDSIQRAELWVIITKKYSLDETVKPTQPIKTILGLAATFGEIEAGNTPPPTEPTEAPAPVVTESALAVAAPPSGNASPEWIKRVKDELVEMTGYPADMLETNVDLEADLGIDSIQRAELWVIITKKYSLDETVKPTQPIKTILGLAATFGEIEAGAKEETPKPKAPKAKKKIEESEISVTPTDWNFFSRTWEFIPKKDIKEFPTKSLLMIVEDTKNHESLRSYFSKKDVHLSLKRISSVQRMGDDTLKELIESVDTIVYLDHLSLMESTKFGDFQKSITKMAGFFRRTATLLDFHKTRVIVPIMMNSAFDEIPQKKRQFFASFPTGFFKSLQKEITNCRFQLITDAKGDYNTLIKKHSELLIDSVEISTINGQFIKPAIAIVAEPDPRPFPLDKGDALFVTGGARGVVFESVFALAQKTECHLILTGRTTLPAAATIAKIALDPHNLTASLKTLEISLVKEKRIPLKEARKEANKLKSIWEINRNLAKLDAEGISYQYEVCDVSDSEKLTALLKKLATDGVTPAGVVHGAGIQHSKKLVDMNDADIVKTVETKLTPLITLYKVLDWKKIKLFAGFGSIAGLFGNFGQTDYALANDLLAEMALLLKNEFPHIHATVIEWTAWSGTGMVSDAEAKRFREGGLIPIDVKSGVHFFLTAISAIQYHRVAVFNRGAALAGSYRILPFPQPAQAIRHFVDDKSDIVSFIPKRDAFLMQHIVKNQPVIPGTFISEMFAEKAIQEGMIAIDISFRRTLTIRGEKFDVEILKQGDRLFTLPADHPDLPEKALENLSFSSCSLAKELPTKLSKRPTFAAKDVTHLEKSGNEVSFYTYLDDTFSDALSTGPVFRGICTTAEINKDYLALVSMTRDSSASFPMDGDFVFNPVLADMAVQVASSWSMLKYEVMAIPYEIKAIEVHNSSSARDFVVVCRADSMSEDTSLFDVTVYEKEGKAVFTLHKMTLKTIAKKDK